MLLSFVSSYVGYSQLNAGMPAFARAVGEVSTRGLGLAFAANTVVIVVLQLVVLQRIEGRRRTRVIAVMGVVWAVSWVLLGATGLVSGTVGATLLVAACASVFAFGESQQARRAAAGGRRRAEPPDLQRLDAARRRLPASADRDRDPVGLPAPARPPARRGRRRSAPRPTDQPPQHQQDARRAPTACFQYVLASTGSTAVPRSSESSRGEVAPAPVVPDGLVVPPACRPLDRQGRSGVAPSAGPDSRCSRQATNWPSSLSETSCMTPRPNWAGLPVIARSVTHLDVGGPAGRRAPWSA